jgi:hypothetical protein
VLLESHIILFRRGLRIPDSLTFLRVQDATGNRAVEGLAKSTADIPNARLPSRAALFKG